MKLVTLNETSPPPVEYFHVFLQPDNFLSNSMAIQKYCNEQGKKVAKQQRSNVDIALASVY